MQGAPRLPPVSGGSQSGIRPTAKEVTRSMCPRANLDLNVIVPISGICAVVCICVL